MKHFATAAAALALSATAAFAVPIAGSVSLGGEYTVGTAPVAIGDTVTVGTGGLPTTGTGGLGDYASVSGIDVLSSFDLIANETPDSTNAGTSFSFGDFVFTIGTTESVTLDNVGLEVFGLGTVSRNAATNDPTTTDDDDQDSSFRFAISGAQTNSATAGTFSLFISTPPEPEDPDMDPIPLPAGLPLLLAGLGAFALVRRKA